jgi:hypothetical protein
VRANLLSALLMSSSAGIRAITLNGVILIGHDGGLVPLDSDRRFQTNFTTLAAAAWYHNRVERRNRTFEQFIAGAAEFAQNEFGPALDAGVRLTSDPARMTHLSMFAGGWYDLIAGTIGAAEYGATRRLPTDRAVIKTYAAGHMVYLGDSNQQFCRDVAEFVTNAANPK